MRTIQAGVSHLQRGRYNAVPEFRFASAADLFNNVPSQVTISFGVKQYNLYNWIDTVFKTTSA